MFYSPELLSLRKKGKLSRCWLAGTLSDRLFKKTVSKKIISSIDISVTCNEILKFINSKERNKYSRFSLYMSAQLMFGAVKLFKIQATLFQDSLFRVKADLNPIDLAPRKGKRTREISLPDDPMIECPAVEFGNLQREDQNLLPETNIDMLGDAAFRDFVESPNFGALTEDEMEFIFFNDEDIRLFASQDRYRHTIDESREQQRSQGHTTDPQNLGLSDALTTIEQSANAEVTAERTITSRKQPSTEINSDAPAKKQRRGVRQEIDVHAEETHEDVAAAFPVDAGVPPHVRFAKIPQDVEIRPSTTFVEPPADVDIPQINESVTLPPPAQEHTAEIGVPVDSNLQLETLQSETPRPVKVRRVRITRQIDEITVLPNAMIGKSLFSNPSVHTIQWVPPVTDRERGMLAEALLHNPASNRRSSRAVDSSRWAEELFFDFRTHTIGPFDADIDKSMSIEAIRLADSGMQTGWVEISKERGQTTGLEGSSGNKTVEESIPVDNAIAGPVVPERVENAFEAPMAVANISDVPMVANISEGQEVYPPPETEILPIPQNMLEDPSASDTVTYNTKLLQSEVRQSVTTNEKSTSDPNTDNTDAFLPPKLRKASVEKMEHQKKSSSSEAIVEIVDSPASNRSQQSEMCSTWNIPELTAYLEISWHDNPIVKLDDLLSPTTRRIDAAVCFVLLLQLQKNGKVRLEQRNNYGTIYITKKYAARHLDLDKA